jgi:hypothetical protein
MPIDPNTWEYYENKEPEASEDSVAPSEEQQSPAPNRVEPFGEEEEVAGTQEQVDTVGQEAGGYFSSGESEREESRGEETDAATNRLRAKLHQEVWKGQKSSFVAKAIDYFNFEFAQGIGSSIIKGFADISGAPEVISEARSAETEAFIAEQPEEEQHYYAWALNKEHALKIQEQLFADKVTHQAFAEEQWYIRWPIQFATLIADPGSYLIGGPIGKAVGGISSKIMKMGAFAGGFAGASQLLETPTAWDDPFTLENYSLNVLASSLTGMILSAGGQLTAKAGAKLFGIVKERLSTNFKPVAFDISSGAVVDKGPRTNWITAVQSQIHSLTPIQEGVSSPFGTIRDLTQRLLSTGGIYNKGEELTSRSITSAMDRNLGSREGYLRFIQNSKELELKFLKANEEANRETYFGLLDRIDAGATSQELEAEGVKEVGALFESRKLSNDLLKQVSKDLFSVEFYWQKKKALARVMANEQKLAIQKKKLEQREQKLGKQKEKLDKRKEKLDKSKEKLEERRAIFGDRLVEESAARLASAEDSIVALEEKIARIEGRLNVAQEKLQARFDEDTPAMTRLMEILKKEAEANSKNVLNAKEYLINENDLLAEVTEPIPYRPRIYDRQAVYKKEKEVKSLFAKGFMRQILLKEQRALEELKQAAIERGNAPEGALELKSIAKWMSEDAIDLKLAQLKKSGVYAFSLKKQERLQKMARERANRAWEDIVGLGPDRGLGHFVEGLHESQMTIGRSILIDDKLLKKLGILITDPYREATLLQERVIPYIHTREVLNESGFEDFGQVRKVLQAERDRMREAASRNPDPVKAQEAVSKIEKAWIDVVDRQLPEMIELAQNGVGLRTNLLSNPKLDLFMNSYRSLAYTRMLGKLPISQLVDLKDIVKRFGLKPTLREIFKSLKPGKVSQGVKLRDDEIRSLGLATEVESLRVRRFMEQSFVDQRDYEMVLPSTKLGPVASRIDSGVKTLSYAFSRAIFASEMNDWAKRIVARLLLSNITKSLSTPFMELTQAELKELGFLRINYAKHLELSKEINKFGTFMDGVLIPNVERWENRKLAESFQAEMLSFVNKTIMTPTMADVPMWMNNKYMKLLFMFKRFAFAHTQHYFQNPNMPIRENMLTWMSTSVVLSALSRGLKLLAAGKLIDLAGSAFWYEVFEDGGFVSNFASMFMHAGKSVVDRVSGKPREDTVGSLIRKEMPFVNDVFDAIDALVKTTRGIVQDEPSKPWSEYELNKFKQIFPFNGLWYLSPFVQYAIHENRSHTLARTYNKTWW